MQYQKTYQWQQKFLVQNIPTPNINKNNIMNFRTVQILTVLHIVIFSSAYLLFMIPNNTEN